MHLSMVSLRCNILECSNFTVGYEEILLLGVEKKLHLISSLNFVAISSL